MKVLCAVFAVLLLFSLATPGKTATHGGEKAGLTPEAVSPLQPWCLGVEGGGSSHLALAVEISDLQLALADDLSHPACTRMR